VCIRTELSSFQKEIASKVLEDLVREYKQQHVGGEEVKALRINYKYATSNAVVMALPHVRSCSLHNFK